MARTKKKILQGKVIKNIFPNKGLVTIDEKNYIMKNVIEGQTVEFTREKRRTDFYDAKCRQILEKSDLETEPGCPACKTCGGCLYQQLSFEAEKNLKQKTLEDLFQDIYPKKITYHQSPLFTGYRAKMEYTFGDTVKGGPLVVGMHSRNRFYEITDTVGCNIVDENFECIRQAVQQYFRETGDDFFHKTTHDGLLRHLILRKSFSKNTYMVNLVTTSAPFDPKPFVAMLRALPIAITSVLHTINDQISDAVICDRLELLQGEPYLEEEMFGLTFQISPFSFFQPNPTMAQEIYRRALELAGSLEGKKVYDLYCGTGTISQIFALRAKEIKGIEIVPEAVEAARQNARLNRLENCTFLCSDVLFALEKIHDADLIVLDPPRSGIHPKAIDRIIENHPEKFIYISCNPLTLRRDLDHFLEKDYLLETVEIFDQFPRTPHVECVALMSRK